MNDACRDSQRLAAIACGQASARDWLEECLQRIEATDAQVNAFTLLMHQRARQRADAIDLRRQRGDKLPPLAGLPFAVKNLFDIAGEVTLAGSVVNQRHAPAAQDAFVLERLEHAGAVLVGALNMDEYAYGFTTENSHYGATHNPHNVNCIAGGSSGGSGAAVAAGQVPVALGSDTNGSIRVPSSLCGVWGLKPTFGRLSRRGSYPFVHNLDHVGPIAQSCELLAQVYDAMQSPDAQDPACFAQSIDPVLPKLDRGVQGLRVGVLSGYFHEHAESVARAAAQQAARLLGAVDEVQWPDAIEARAAAFITSAAEGGSLHLPELRELAQDFEPLSVDRFMAGALQPSHWLVQAQRFRRLYREHVQELFGHWDVLIAPATPVTAPPIGTSWLNINGVRHPCRAAMGLLTQPISYAGCPVVTAPLWLDGAAGMPIGVQVIAAPWREDLAFRAARALEIGGLAHTRSTTL